MEENVSELCPICGREFKEDDDVKICDKCKTKYHQACWDKNDGCMNEQCRKIDSDNTNADECKAHDTNKCKKCGHDLEQGRRFCSNCGEPSDAGSEGGSPVKNTCTECGAQLAQNQKYCPKCGKKVENAFSGATVPSRPKLGGAAALAGKSGKKRTKIIAIAAVCIIAIIIVIAAVNANVLMGDDKVAYDLIMDVANDFKDPSSVRLVSGTVGVDKDCLFCGISATNGFGARTTSYYFIMEDTTDTFIVKQDDAGSLYKSTSNLNTKKINKALEKSLKK